MEVEKTKGIQHIITKNTIRLLGSARSTSLFFNFDSQLLVFVCQTLLNLVDDNQVFPVHDHR